MQAGSPPDVWLQLLERCVAADRGCQATALRSLAQQLTEQRALSARQQQQLAAQQQVAVEQEAQIVALKGQLQQLAAEQGARITALEGQLQQLLQRLQ